MNDLNQIHHPGSDTGTTSKISTKTGEWKPEWNQPVSFPVEATQIYTHVMACPGVGAPSPVDL